MKTARVCSVYFSATDTTKKIVAHVAHEVAEKLNVDVNTIDFTLPASRQNDLCFESSDVVIFGVPVIAGRVPNVLLPFLNEKIKGHGAFAVPIVLYGNRNFDDALIELRNILEGNNFHTIAAGAFVGEHSFSKVLGAGRPDDHDLQSADRLAQLVISRLNSSPEVTCSPVSVKGETPLRPYYTPRDRKGNPVNILKVKPKTKDSCIKCGLCASVCPMGSISHDDPSIFTGICMKCGACVKKCPVGAKFYDDEAYLYHQHELEEGFARRAEPEIF